MKSRTPSYFRGLFAVIVLGIIVASSAAQAFEISVVGGGDLAKPSIESGGTSVTGSSKAAFGGGFLVGFNLNFVTELEFGALYMGRHYTYPVASGTGEDSYSRYEIPVILRLNLLKYLTIGGGAYYSVPTGQSTYTLTPSGSSGSSTTSNAADNFKNDFGGVGSVSIKIPLNIATSLVLDGRYLYGLINTTKASAETIKTRDIEALIGFNFGF
jgi:hypothetical protein